MSFHIVVWWGWHLPPAFDLALRNDLVHALEHACLFLGGPGPVVGVPGRALDDRGGLAILYLFGAAVATGMVGVLLTLDPDSRSTQRRSPVRHRWGLTRLGDQQLGGVIMWVIGGAIYLSVATVLATRWLSLGPPPRRRSAGAAGRAVVERPALTTPVSRRSSPGGCGRGARPVT